MTSPLAETSPTSRGRILAAFYLLVIIGGITAQSSISDRLVVRNDAVGQSRAWLKPTLRCSALWESLRFSS
jgi:hypothetical protein